MTSVFVATPYTRPHVDPYLESLLFMKKPEVIHRKAKYGLSIDLSRNVLMDIYQDTRDDFILWVDNDCGFPAEALDRLLSHNLPMVCGCMYTRDIPPTPPIGKYAGMTKDGKHIYKFAEVAKAIVKHAYSHGVETIKENEYLFPKTDNDLLEIDGCGMHFTLIRRDVIDALTLPYFQFMMNVLGGEDFYFCQKVRKAGFPIYVDLSVHTAHYAGEENSFGLRELLEFCKYVDVEASFNNDYSRLVV